MSGGTTPSQTQQTQTQTQQTNSSTAPPSYLQPYLKQGIQALVDNFNANPTAPAYYPGATVAPPSQATQSAIADGIRARRPAARPWSRPPTTAS